jgi:hypothetical protein
MSAVELRDKKKYVCEVRSYVKPYLFFIPTINILNFRNIRTYHGHMKVHYIVKKHVTLCHVNTGIAPSNSDQSKDEK